MKEIKKMEKFTIPDCCMCDNELTERDPYKVTFKDSTVGYACNDCGGNLADFLEIDKAKIEEIYI